MGLEGATKRERPGNPHPAKYATRGGSFGAADEPDQSRFARAVSTENAEILAASEPKIDVTKHLTSPVPGGVNLRNMFYSEHAKTPLDG